MISKREMKIFQHEHLISIHSIRSSGLQLMFLGLVSLVMRMVVVSLFCLLACWIFSRSVNLHFLPWPVGCNNSVYFIWGDTCSEYTLSWQWSPAIQIFINGYLRYSLLWQGCQQHMTFYTISYIASSVVLSDINSIFLTFNNSLQISWVD